MICNRIIDVLAKPTLHRPPALRSGARSVGIESSSRLVPARSVEPSEFEFGLVEADSPEKPVAATSP